MTDNPTVRGKPAGQQTWLWMIVSLIAVGGFLGWLAASSAPTEVTVVEEEEGMAARAVTLSELEASVDSLLGQTIRLADVSVASPLGPRAFWTTTPNGTPFLIKLDTALVSQGTAVKAGDVVTVAGLVHMMSDSVLEAWTTAGVLNESQRMEAEFATSFLEAVEAKAKAQPEGEGAADAGAADADAAGADAAAADAAEAEDA